MADNKKMKLSKEEQVELAELEELDRLEKQAEKQEPAEASDFKKALPFQDKSIYEKGERSAIGNVFERPAAAVRSGIQGAINPKEGQSRLAGAIEGYVEGAVNPEDVNKFQDIFLDNYYENYDSTKRGNVRDAIQVAGGFGISTAGLLADIVTSPGDLLLLLAGKTPMGGGKTLGSIAASTKAGQKVKQIATTPITAKNIANVAKKTAEVTAKAVKHGVARLPKVMNENWFVGQKKQGMEVLKQARQLRGKMFEIRNPYKSTPIDPKIGRDILKNTMLDEETARLVNRVFGSFDETGKTIKDGINNIDDVGKMYLLNDILSKQQGAMYKPQNMVGKGGMTNPQIRAVPAKQAVKQAIYNEISKTDADGAKLLAKLDEDAANVLYPYINKLSSVFERPEGTEGIQSVYALSGGRYQTGMGKAGHRVALRKGPKEVSDVAKNYLKGNYTRDIKNFNKVANQIAKDMGAYRKRAAEKGLVIGTGGGIGAVLAYKALGQKLKGE